MAVLETGRDYTARATLQNTNVGTFTLRSLFMQAATLDNVHAVTVPFQPSVDVSAGTSVTVEAGPVRFAVAGQWRARIFGWIGTVTPASVFATDPLPLTVIDNFVSVTPSGLLVRIKKKTMFTMAVESPPDLTMWDLLDLIRQAGGQPSTAWRWTGAAWSSLPYSFGRSDFSNRPILAYGGYALAQVSGAPEVQIEVPGSALANRPVTVVKTLTHLPIVAAFAPNDVQSVVASLQRATVPLTHLYGYARDDVAESFTVSSMAGDLTVLLPGRMYLVRVVDSGSWSWTPGS